MESDECDLNVVCKSNWNFANSMYGLMSKATESFGNILFSPLSLQVILSLTYTGTRDYTAQQMAKALHLPDRPDAIKSGFKLLLQLLSSGEKVTLETATKILPSTDNPIWTEFSENAREYFDVDVESVDYGVPSKVVEAINGWAMKETHGKITDVVSEETVDPATRLILLNAVYFKGGWAKAFDASLTSPQPFHVTSSEVKTVPMMRLFSGCSYSENEEIGAILLELPYKDNNTSLVVILPRTKHGLANVEERLEKIGLDKVIGTRKKFRRQVDLSFPKFNLQLSSKLNSVLQRLGMIRMFSDDSDFSWMTSKRGLFVSSVLHKTMIEVSEEGTEPNLDAVTPSHVILPHVASSHLMLTDLPVPPERVVVDQPFAFALVSWEPRVVLFMGRFTGKEGVLSQEALSEARSLDSKASSCSSKAGCSTPFGGMYSFILGLLFILHCLPTSF